MLYTVVRVDLLNINVKMFPFIILSALKPDR